MIIEWIVNFIFSAPFFSRLTLSDTVLNAVSQFYYKIAGFSSLLNIQALIDTFLIAFGFYLLLCLIRLIIDLL